MRARWDSIVESKVVDSLMTNKMDCAQARHYLGPDGGPLHPVLRAQIDDHVAECVECSDYFTLDAVLLDAYARLRRERASEEVRGKVAGALHVLEEGQPSGSPSRVRSLPRRWAAWPAAAVVAAAALAAVVFTENGPQPALQMDPPGSAFLEDYVRRASAGEHVSTSDPAEVTAFLAERLGVQLEPLVVEGLVVEGAEVCLLDGQLGALILYKLDGVVLSHYLIPREQALPRPPSVGRILPAGEMDLQDLRDEVNFVTWASPQLEQALMGPAETSKMVDLARNAIGG